jgi:hypothetical protein
MKDRLVVCCISAISKKGIRARSETTREGGLIDRTKRRDFSSLSCGS